MYDFVHPPDLFLLVRRMEARIEDIICKENISQKVGAVESREQRAYEDEDEAALSRSNKETRRGLERQAHSHTQTAFNRL